MADIAKNVTIGIAQLGVVKRPDTITTYALGSCVGVVLYDRVSGVTGMVHVLLPNLETGTIEDKANRAKYASTGVDALLEEMLKNGSRRMNLQAKLAGGASMFGASAAGLLNIGLRNVEECKKALKRLNLPIMAEDTAGKSGRTITMDSITGMLLVKTVGKGEKHI